MKCIFCGYEFEEAMAQQACAGCFLAKGCKLIRCPMCHYEWPADQEGGNVFPLIKIRIGAEKEIVSLGTPEEEYLKKLINLGIIPGIKITLLRRSPALLCRVGNSQIALDYDLAQFIYVK